jgi:phospholipid transport system transporter-binding protein
MSDLAIDTAPGGVRISGNLGFRTPAGRLRDADRKMVAVARDAVVDVDVAGLEQVDSATLAILLAWSAHARRDGAGLRYLGIPGDLAALARLAEASELLDPPA